MLQIRVRGLVNAQAELAKIGAAVFMNLSVDKRTKRWLTALGKTGGEQR